MGIKINGSTSGSVELDVPAVVSGGDIAFTLPTSVGSAGQYLRNSSTAGTLEFGTIPGSFTSYAIICDEKADTTNGGTFTSGAWRTRDLNTEIADPDGIVSISSNQFTLGAGSYLIEASAPAYDIERHQTRLYNATSSSVVQYGQSVYADSNYNVNNFSNVLARVTVTSSTAFEIQHRCGTTGSVNGFGVNTEFGNVCIFTVVKIFKEA